MPSHVNVAISPALVVDGIKTSAFGSIAVTDSSAEENVARNTGNSLDGRPVAGIRRIGDELSTKL